MTTSRGNLRLRSLFVILPLIIVSVQGRKHPDDSDYGPDSEYGPGGYGGDQYGGNDVGDENYGGYGMGNESPMGENVNPPGVASTAEITDSGSNGIKWISPLPGDSLPSGKSMTVTWSSTNPSYSPSFSLCTSNPGSNEADCGNENWPNVKNNNDGTFSAVVTMPVISQSIEKLYLSMNNNNGDTCNSPVFSVKGDSGVPNAYLASPVNPAALAPTILPTSTGLVDELGNTATNTLGMISATGIPSSSVKAKTTAAKSISPAISPTPTPIRPLSSTLPLYASITLLQAQAPLQASIAPTSIPIYTAQSMTSSPTSGVISTLKESNKPNIKAIALPISICGLILIASLIFCARSKRFKKTGLGKDVENDWHEVIKRKAALSSAGIATSENASKGVEVKERKFDNNLEKEGNGNGIIPTLGYNGRSNSQDSSYSTKDTRSNVREYGRRAEYESKRDPNERFTEIPQVDYDRRGSRQHRDRVNDPRREIDGDGDREKERKHRHRHINHRESSYNSERSKNFREYDYNYDRDSRSNPNSKDYYSTSRKSTGGIGGIYDDYSKDYRRSLHSGSRLNLDSYFKSSSNRDRDREFHELGSNSARNYGHNQSRSSTRELYTPPPPLLSSVNRPKTLNHNESYLEPLSNPYEPNHHHQSTTRQNSFDKRPLPEPIIRSTTNLSGSSLNLNTRDTLEYGYEIPRQKNLPHLSGGLIDDQYFSSQKGMYGASRSGRERERRGGERERERRGERQFESDTEAGWELDLNVSNTGKYRSGDEGMGELYEDLRRAIQRG